MADATDIRFDIGILSLLRDENGAVIEKQIGELLRARRERAVPLILHSLGVSPNTTDGFDEPGQFMVEGLVNAWRDGVNVPHYMEAALEDKTSGVRVPASAWPVGKSL
jgi:hypothetical protein